MADLTYTITTVTELAGAQAQQQALEKQIGAAKALGKDYSALQAQLDAVNQSMANAKVPVDDLRKAEEGLNEQKHNMIANLKALRHEHIPGLGQALHILRHPITIIAVAIGLVVEQFREFIKMVKEAEASMESFANITRHVENLRLRAAEARGDMEALARTLKNQAEQADAASVRFERMEESLKRQAGLTKALVNAEAEASKARIKLQEARGEISGPAAERATLAVDIATGQRHLRDANRLREMQVSSQNVRRILLEHEIAAAGAALTGAESALGSATAPRDKAVKLAEDTAKLSEENIKKLKAKRAGVTGPTRVDGKLVGAGGIELQEGLGLKTVEEQQEEIDKDIEQEEKNIKDEATKAESAKNKFEAIKDRRDTLKATVAEKSKKLLDEKRKLEELKAATEEETANEKTIESLKEETEKAKAEAKEVKERKEAIKGRERLLKQSSLHHGALTDAQQDELSKYNQTISDTNPPAPATAPAPSPPGLRQHGYGLGTTETIIVNGLNSLGDAIVEAITGVHKRVDAAKRQNDQR